MRGDGVGRILPYIEKVAVENAIVYEAKSKNKEENQWTLTKVYLLNVRLTCWSFEFTCDRIGTVYFYFESYICLAALL